MYEIENGMSAAEFADWQTFLADYPLPIELADVHASMAFALQANIYRAKGDPTVDFREFLLIGAQRRAEAKSTLTIAQQMKRAAEG